MTAFLDCFREWVTTIDFAEPFEIEHYFDKILETVLVGRDLLQEVARVPIDDDLAEVEYEGINLGFVFQRFVIFVFSCLQAKTKEFNALSALAENKIKETQERLIHSEKLSSLGKFAGTVAHEFNNPLFGVINLIEHLGDELEKKERKKFKDWTFFKD